MIANVQKRAQSAPPAHQEARFALITLAVLAVIVYGSLYPFEFYARGSLRDAVAFLLSTSVGSADRGDVISNILLYLPFGLFASRTLRRLPPAGRFLLVAAAGGALTVSIELTQFWDLTRAPELSDVASNFLGTVLGAAAEFVLRPQLFPRMKWRPFTMLLFASAIGAWLSPFFPALRPAHYVRALHLLSADVPFEAEVIFKYAAVWLAAAALIDALFGSASRFILPALIAIVIPARLTNPFTPLTRAEITGAILAAALWIAFLYKSPLRTRIVAVIFASYVVIDALRPFTFLAHARPFGWRPFLAFMNGPRGGGSQVFLEKTFTYGTLLWLFVESGISRLPATFLALILVSASRAAEMWLPGRSAELTDPLMVLILAGVFTLLRD